MKVYLVEFCNGEYCEIEKAFRTKAAAERFREQKLAEERDNPRPTWASPGWFVRELDVE